MPSHDAGTSAELVRAQMAQAVRARRSRETVRVLARIAPVGAAIALVAAAIGRFLGWRPVLPLSLLAALAVGLGVYVLVQRRVRAVSDVIAAGVDADAGLGGELRSAHWFASQEAPTAWPLFHLERAAARVGAVAWSQVYPPVRAHRAWATTALLVVAALALTVHVLPAKPAPASMAAVLAGAAADAGVILPPDFAKKLQDLLAGAEAGTLSAADARRLADLNAILKKIDPNSDPQLADLLKRLQAAAAKAATDQKPASASDLAKMGDASKTPDDLKAAMEDLASKLANGQTAEKPDGSFNEAPKLNEGQFGKASSQAQASQANAVQAAVQLVREAASDPGQGQPMLGGGAMGGDSSAGRGGNAGAKTGAALAALKAEALRKELVEANADMAGANVTKEDLRRKTEQGKSVLAFTHVAAATTVDKSRAAAPPPVPDARRALVQSYFIRHQ
jgi:hypothetical protein